jgi:hypothetical protein
VGRQDDGDTVVVHEFNHTQPKQVGNHNVWHMLQARQARTLQRWWVSL